MATNRIWRAAMAGYLYPAEPDVLREAAVRAALRNTRAIAARGALVPHGSFQECGPIIGETLGQLLWPSRCLILASSHTGAGAPWSLLCDGAYRTPLGEMPIDAELAEALMRACPHVSADSAAHRGEHAVEVLLPWLQVLGPRTLRVVPLVVRRPSAEATDEVAQALAREIAHSPEPIVVLGSSDLSHHVAREQAVACDDRLLGALRMPDAGRWRRTVAQTRANVCGEAAVACLVATMRLVGAAEGRVVRYATSADTGGDPESVIGYAGLIFN